MKTVLVVGVLLLGISGQAFSMGHPHNVFAARKQLRTKASTSITKTKMACPPTWQRAVRETKNSLGEHLLQALSHVNPLRAY
ncbi:hypothetical protein GCM10028805_05880 [Spirosoma harenae]